MASPLTPTLSPRRGGRREPEHPRELAQQSPAGETETRGGASGPGYGVASAFGAARFEGWTRGGSPGCFG